MIPVWQWFLGFGVLDSRCWILDPGCWLLDIESDGLQMFYPLRLCALARDICVVVHRTGKEDADI